MTSEAGGKLETREIEFITKAVLAAMDKQKSDEKGYVVPVGVSARHVHLTQEHVEILFGD